MMLCSLIILFISAASSLLHSTLTNLIRFILTVSILVEAMEVEHQICNAWLLESSHGQQAPPDVKGIGALLSLLVNKTLPIKIFP